MDFGVKGRARRGYFFGVERFGDGLVLLEVWGVGVLLDRYRVDWELTIPATL